MYWIEPQITAREVIGAFHRDIPYLFLGAAFVAVGLLSAAFSALRRKHDPLLVYFAIFAVLYGLRLWIQSRVVSISVPASMFYPRFRQGINYIVPIPAILFFDAAGLLGKWGKIAGYVLLAFSCALALATFGLGPSTVYDRINSMVVILAMLALVLQNAPTAAASSDFSIVRRGLLVFAALVLWDNVTGALQITQPSLEAFGFAAFLISLGYVAARRTLHRENQLKEIQNELEVARRIQLSILPSEFPETPHFKVSARYLPMTSVAGDFYDYVVAGPKQAGLLIADVSGHGVPAALIASMVKLAAASQKEHANDPSIFLTRLNSVLLGNTQNQFVTAAYVHLDSNARELRYAAAGHPPMLLLRRGKIMEVAENGLMLALFDFASYSNMTQELECGDRVLLYTDGLVEAANANGDFFGREALCEVFRKTQGTGVSDAADMILSKVKAWAKVQEDDLTLLVCDYVG
jgi:sigma-B regulation protein RsbU (phosphoserine phosphatase)